MTWEEILSYVNIGIAGIMLLGFITHRIVSRPAHDEVRQLLEKEIAEARAERDAWRRTSEAQDARGDLIVEAVRGVAANQQRTLEILETVFPRSGTGGRSQ